MLKPALAKFESGGRMLKPVLGQIRIWAPDAETGGGQIRIRAIPDAETHRIHGWGGGSWRKSEF